MRVLLVEDEATLADSVRQNLRADGIESDWADNGIDGLWMAIEGSYDVIVLDVMLPGQNGYEVCRELRLAEKWTPVLMLTAKAGELDEAEALDFGADDYLRKPFHHVVLVARLRALARRRDGTRADVIERAGLVIDTGAQTCARGGTVIQLSPREFAVLEALARHSPAVMSKRELLLAVWGIDFEGDPNIVEVYVGYLRKKIDRRFDEEIVNTVRGAGYRLGPP